MGAIGKGKTKAELDHKKLNKALKDKLSLKRDIAAMKFTDKVPEGVSVEDGLTFWCHICGDIFEGKGNPSFFSAGNSTCGGSSALGLGARQNITKEEFKTVMEVIAGEGGYFASQDLFTKGRSLFPLFPKVYRGIVLGSLELLSLPDIILFPLNGHQMCIVSTAYAFETGEIIMGNAGAGTCLGTVTIPFLENKPVFTCGDHGGRMHMRLTDEEILVCIPYKLVPGLVRNIERTIYAQGSHSGKE